MPSVQTPPQQGNTNLQSVNGNTLVINADGSITTVQEAASLNSGTLQALAAANGNGTPLLLSGEASVIFTLALAAFSGVVNFEGSEDGVNFDPLECTQAGTSNIVNSVTGVTATSTHLYLASTSGLVSVRARISGFSAGTANVTGHAGPETFATHAQNIAQVAGSAIPAIADALAFAGQMPAVLEGQTGTGVTSVQRIPNVFKSFAAQAITAGTPVAIWTPAAGKKFRLMGYDLALSVAGYIIFKDAAAVILDSELMAAAVGQASAPMGNGILSAAANNALNLDVSATGAVTGWVCGIEE